MHKFIFLYQLFQSNIYLQSYKHEASRGVIRRAMMKMGLQYGKKHKLMVSFSANCSAVCSISMILAVFLIGYFDSKTKSKKD